MLYVMKLQSWLFLFFAMDMPKNDVNSWKGHVLHWLKLNYLRVHSFTTKLKAAPDAYRMPHFTDHRRFSIIESDSLARLAKMKK